MGESVMIEPNTPEERAALEYPEVERLWEKYFAAHARYALAVTPSKEKTALNGMKYWRKKSAKAGDRAISKVRNAH